MSAIDELKELQKLLVLEKEEELKLYQTLLENNSVNQRKKLGVCWYPLEIQGKGYGMGDYPYVEISCATATGSNKFSSGKMVSLFSTHGEYESQKVTGVIHYIHKNNMKIILYADDFPEWMGDGKIGVDLLFDAQSYKEMDIALEKAIDAERNRFAELRDIILGHKPTEPIDNKFKIEIPHLNASQNEALHQAINTKDVAIIHGPPGTGKTTTLVEIIKQLVKNEKQILVCAPSNAAADLLTVKCAEASVEVVRIGNISRIDEALHDQTLEGKTAKHDDFKHIKKIKREASELREMALKYKRNFGREEREQRKLVLREAKARANDAIELEDYLVEKVLSSAQVLTTTLVGTMNRYIRNREYSTVIIDEAAQALEPATWIPISKADKVILAGDPFQLPPTVKSPEAKKLSITLIEKCIQRLDNVSLLKTQYRMNNVIMGFSNQEFYDNELLADESVAAWNIDDVPLEFVDTAGCSLDEKRNSETLSLLNEGEADILYKHLSVFLENNLSTTIGVISPYRGQVEVLKDQLESWENVTVNTIDSFQGQERDVIYISLVRSNESGEIGFLSDYRRMNVAMTRAKKKLVVIGDSATLGGQKFYQHFLDYVEAHGSYKTAWEYLY